MWGLLPLQKIHNCGAYLSCHKEVCAFKPDILLFQVNFSKTKRLRQKNKPKQQVRKIFPIIFFVLYIFAFLVKCMARGSSWKIMFKEFRNFCSSLQRIGRYFHGQDYIEKITSFLIFRKKIQAHP